MSSEILLSKEDYTIYNALSWRNCFSHYEQAWDTETPLFQRVVHGTVAVLEFFPIASQVVSLSEMALCRLIPRVSFADLMKKGVRRIESREAQLPHQFRMATPSHPSSDVTEVQLTDQVAYLRTATSPLHRQIENQYGDLSWPPEIQKIVVYTDVLGGRGDIAAAAKAIAVMQQISPTLTFDWILKCYRQDQYNPLSFVDSPDPSKIKVRISGSNPSDPSPGDLLLIGPGIPRFFGIDGLEKEISRKIGGPIFRFAEIASLTSGIELAMLQGFARNTHPAVSSDQMYQMMHQNLFFVTADFDDKFLPLGIRPGSGVFLDRRRIEAPLSRGYCCPSYIKQIEDPSLRKDLLQAMNVFDDRSEPNYDQFSLNSGYAHHFTSWVKFIDCVAMHEKNKHVVIVINQQGTFGPLTTHEFKEKVFTPERLAFLKQKGYGTVALKGKGVEAWLLQEANDPLSDRRLTVIVRHLFTPRDMRSMQLASERLLTTGDNSVVEAWCARCKLYLYEDVAIGMKWRFLQEQVDEAKNISPNLSQLLACFGGDQRLPDPCRNQFLTDQKMNELELLLNDPDLSDATLQFCDAMTAKRPFEEILRAALKRTVWHHCIPELAKIEAETMDPDFRNGLVGYFESSKKIPTTFQVRIPPEMKVRIQEAVRNYSSPGGFA